MARWPPDAWVDELADKLETRRVLDMGVLKKLEEFDGKVVGRLATKFVRDWGVKLFVRDGDCRMRWMRRSRYVARDFVTGRRDDTFSPATGAHTNNILPVVFFKMLEDSKGQSSTYLQACPVLVGHW